MFIANVPLTPRQPGGPLRVPVIDRASAVVPGGETAAGPGHRIAAALRARYPGPLHVETRVVRACGDAADVPVGPVPAGEDRDLIVAEDLGRLHRDPVRAAALIEALVRDHGARVLIVAEGLDTADPGWERALPCRSGRDTSGSRPGREGAAHPAGAAPDDGRPSRP